MIVCAFTGHRPAKLSFGYDETSALCQAIKRELGIAAEKLIIQKKVRRFLVGGALGVDMWAGESILSLMSSYDDVSLCCVMPFRGYNENWPPLASERLHKITDKADAIYLQDGYSPDAYTARNRYLADHSDYLIAVYDDGHTAAASGTGQTVRYAQCRGRSIVLIHPDNAAVSYWFPPDKKKNASGLAAEA